MVPFPTSGRRDVPGVFLVHVITEGMMLVVSIFDALVCSVCVLHVGCRFQIERRCIHCQSAKNIYSYFKSQLYVEDLGHGKQVLILPNGLSKPGDQARDRNLLWMGFEPTTSRLTVQCLTTRPPSLS